MKLRALACLALFGACLDPTEITIVLQTNFACSDFGGARIRVGSQFTDTTACKPGSNGIADVGTLVVVPSGSLDRAIDIAVYGAVVDGQPAPSLDTCAAQATNDNGCVTTTRALHFILHQPLTLPILIDSRCAHVNCPTNTTCVAGACVSIQCEASSCNPDAGVDSGLVDSGTDAGSTPLNVTSLSAWGDGTCASLDTGQIVCWGTNASNRFGALGTQGTVPPSFVPTITNASRVALGSNFACALTTSGGIECWGDNFRGQLGDGTNAARATPVLVVGGPSVYGAVFAGEAHACGITPFPGKLYCWGSNVNGQLAQPTTQVSNPTPTLASGTLTLLSACAGSSHTCAIGNGSGQATTDNAYCWGDNGGAFGKPGVTTTPTIVPNVTLPDFVACGVVHTVAAEANGPTGTLAWGDNSYGRVDPKTTNSPLLPAIVAPYMIPAVTGDAVTCGLVSGGTISCWGDATAGELGPNASGAGPASITLSAPVKQLATGGKHVCATITPSTDEVWCWGDGDPNPKRILP